MKNILFLILFAAIACTNETPEENVAIVEKEADIKSVINTYDSAYAAHLGADEYGMKRYVMAFLKAGPNRNQDSLTAVNLQRAHMENIERMAREGKLVVAGPFLDGGEFKGIYVFNVETLEEAKALTETDPAVEAGRLVMELHPWYGSAALMEINNIHGRLSSGK